MANERDLLEQVEQMVDEWGLSTVLQALRDVCVVKAAHVITNWDDQTQARAWDRAGTRIQHAANWAKADPPVPEGAEFRQAAGRSKRS